MTPQLEYGPNNTLVQLDVQNAAPPSDTYVTLDDVLTTHVISSAIAGSAVYVSVRLLLPNGKVQMNQFVYFPSSSRITQVFFANLAEGFILSVTATGGGGTIGQMYVNVCLSRGLVAQSFPANGQYGEILLQGYVSFNNPLTYPRGQFGSTQSQFGNIRSVTGTTPAAGAEIAETVPNGAIWQLMSIAFTLTTAAAVANRNMHLLMDDGTSVLMDTAAASAVAASLTMRFWGTGARTQGSPVDGTMGVPLIPVMLMAAGYRLRTSTTGLQSGDQYSAVQYQVQEWIAG